MANKFKVLALSLAISLLGIAHAQSSMTQAQGQGLTAGDSLNKSVAGSLTQSNAAAAIPGFTGQVPSNLTSSYGSSSLFPQGTTRNTECDAKGYVEKGSQKDQECNASIVLRQNTNKQNFASNDPILGIRGDFSKLNTGGAVGSQTCSSLVTTTPDTTIQQTCNDYLNSVNQDCTNAVFVTFNSAPGCQVDGQYLGMTSKNICPHCIDPFVITEYYCSAGSYLATGYTSPSGVKGDVFYQLFSNVRVNATVGVNINNSFIGDFGSGCNFPMYYSQTCGATTCSMTTSLIGSSCNGRDFAAQGFFDIPTTWTINEQWNNGCSVFDAAIKR